MNPSIQSSLLLIENNSSVFKSLFQEINFELAENYQIFKVMDDNLAEAQKEITRQKYHALVVSLDVNNSDITQFLKFIDAVADKLPVIAIMSIENQHICEVLFQHGIEDIVLASKVKVSDLDSRILNSMRRFNAKECEKDCEIKNQKIIEMIDKINSGQIQEKGIPSLFQQIAALQSASVVCMYEYESKSNIFVEVYSNKLNHRLNTVIEKRENEEFQTLMDTMTSSRPITHTGVVATNIYFPLKMDGVAFRVLRIELFGLAPEQETLIASFEHCAKYLSYTMKRNEFMELANLEKDIAEYFFHSKDRNESMNFLSYSLGASLSAQIVEIVPGHQNGKKNNITLGIRDSRHEYTEFCKIIKTPAIKPKDLQRVAVFYERCIEQNVNKIKSLIRVSFTQDNYLEYVDFFCDRFVSYDAINLNFFETIGNLISDYLAKEEKSEQVIKVNESLNYFISALSHELRNPLAVLRTGVEYLHNKNKEDNQDLELSRRLLYQVNFLGKLVEDLLDLNRVKNNRIKLEKEYISLEDLVEQAFSNVQLELKEKDITFEKNIASNVMLYVDRFRIVQVFINLFSNSLKYTPSGGQITIETKNKTDDVIEIYFSDTGTGIDEDTQKHVFKEYYQEHISSSGLGMGLYISKNILELHKADIFLEKTSGLGTTFKIEIPCICNANVTCIVNSENNKLKNEMKFKGAGETILVVDDNFDSGNVAKKLIDLNGYKSYSVNSGEEALKFIDFKKPDLVLLDLNMPDMDGYETAMNIRKRDLDIPIIIYSGVLDEKNIRRLKNIGVDFVLPKNSSTEQLFKLINLGLELKQKNKSFKDKSILWLDDSKDFLYMVDVVLNDKFNLKLASNIQELEDLIDETEKIDLILLDYTLEDQTGVEAIGRLRKNPVFAQKIDNSKIAIVTGYQSESSILNDVPEEYRIISKPTKIEEFENLIASQF